MLVTLDRPVLITGAPRSGKTTIRLVMQAANEFLCADEPLMAWDQGLGGRPHDRFTAEDATPDVCRRIRRDCARMLERAGKQRYLDDLSYHALRIPFVRAVLPGVRIVHVIRSAEEAIPELLYGWTYRDTVRRVVRHRWRNLRLRGLPRTLGRFMHNYVASRMYGRRATLGPRPPGLDRLNGSDLIELAAYQWASMVRFAMDDLAACSPDSWLEVRLDRLLSEPTRELERIVTFCEPQEPDVVLRYGEKLIDPHQFRMKIQPGVAEWEKIRHMIAPLQQRLGYWPSYTTFQPTHL